jgi:hypothetical protein
MRIYRTGNPDTFAALRTARTILVTWEDGGRQSMGVPDHIKDGDLVDWLTSGSPRRVRCWTETAPRDNRPQVPPD